jgi:hypothetical protein
MFKKIQKELKVSKDGEKNVVEALYEQPKKDKGKAVPSYKRGGAEPSQVYSADLLTMPEDKGYNYLLVVVDTITGLTDASPLKNKDAESVLRGFKDIFAKGTPLAMPKWSIQLDEGTEFKSVVKKYFEENGVLIRYGKVDRSRHQALAENRNKIIAKALFQKQVAQEILTNTTSTNWVDDVQIVLDMINEYERGKYKIEKQREGKRLQKGMAIPYLPKGTVILEVGTKVRVKLDKPRGVLGEKLHGTFRATDIKWDPRIRTIKNIILTPNQPVMYQVEGETTGYTRNQLQIVDANEKQPPQELMPKASEMKEAQQTLKEEIPKVMSDAVANSLKSSKDDVSSVKQAVPQGEDERPKKIQKPAKTASASYTPIPLTSITPTQTRSGRQVKPKKVFE